MSKRGPDEYLTKEHGSTPNQGFKEESRKMATSAQLARRKIAQPRSRMARNGPSNSGTSTPKANPFTSMNTNPQPQQQTFGSVNGVTFGAQSQSFPQTGATSNTGFNFSAPDANNPFANSNFTNPSGNASFGSLNGGSQASFGGTFGQNGGDVSMESPEKKQQSSFVFGQPAPSSSVFNFSTSQPPASQFNTGAFPSQNDEPATSNGLLGRVTMPPDTKAEPPAAGLSGNSSNAFGSSQPHQPLFGANTSSSTFNFGAPNQPATAAASTSFSFGQSVGTPKPVQNGASTPFKFGGATTTTTTQATTPNLFGGGNTPATAPAKSVFNFAGSQTETSGNNLYSVSQTEEPAVSKVGRSLFPSTQPPADKPSTAATPAFAFGAPSVFPASKAAQDKFPKASGNLFADLRPLSQEPNSTATLKPPAPVQPLESASDSEPDKPQEGSKNPFSGLFGAQTTANVSEAGRPGNSTFSSFAPPAQSGPPTLATSFFGNASQAPSNPSSMFSSPGKAADSSKEAPASKQPGSEAPSFDTSEKVSDAPDFSESTILPDTPCPLGRSTKRMKVNPMKDIPAYYSQISQESAQSLFGHLQKISGPTNPSVFLPNTTSSQPLQQTQVQSREVSPSSFIAGSTPGPSSGPDTSVPANTAPQKRLFDTFRSDTTPSQPVIAPPVPTQTAPPSFASTAPIAKATPTVAAATPKPTSTSQIAKKPVFNQASASSVPTHLNSEGYKEFDNQDKLRALNRSFQRQITAVDVVNHDIDTLLRVYIAARSSIGADIGLYQRAFAGTKRKSDQSESPPVPSAYKKTRLEGSEATSTSEPASSALLSGQPQLPAFKPSGPTPSTSNNTFGKSVQESKPTEQSKASQLLGQMIPRSPAKTPSQPQQSPEKPRNPFGDLKYLPNFSGPVAPASSSTAASFVPVSSSKPPPFMPPSSSGPAPFIPSFNQSNPSTTPSKPSTGFQPSTTPIKSPSKPTGFQISGPVSDGFSAFGQKADTGAKKRRAELLEEEFDSDEDSQAEGEKKLLEQERAKKVKYDSIAKTGFTPNFGGPASASKPSPKKSHPFESDSSGSENADDEGTSDEITQRDEDGEEDSAMEDDGEEESDQEQKEGDDVYHEGEDAVVTEPSREPSPDEINKMIAENPNAGRSLMDRISAPPQKTRDDAASRDVDSAAILNSTTKAGWKAAPKFAGIGMSTPQQPAFSPITPDISHQPASSFHFTGSSTPNTDSGSVLGAPSSVPPQYEGLFGSRPSTPSHADQPSNPPHSIPADHTWKQGSPIKFGTSTPENNSDAPRFSFTSPSPSNKDSASEPPKLFGNSLFGKTGPNSLSKPDGSVGFSFGQSSVAPAPGFLSAAPYLGIAGSTASSAISSRQSSPGLTDNESVATDVTDTDLPTPDEQAKYTEARAGEEDDELVYEVPTVKALRLANDKTATPKDPKGTWVTIGQGPLRILKNKDGKTRVLIRNTTNGNVILNEYLQPRLAWAAQPQQMSSGGKVSAGAVKGFIAQGGILNQWVLKLKAGKEGELAETLERERKAQESSS